MLRGMKTKHRNMALVAACDIVGGVRKMADILGVTKPAVWQWCVGVRQVPVKRCPEIEAACGGRVTCEKLRGDVQWDVLRKPRKRRQRPPAQGVTGVTLGDTSAFGVAEARP